MLRILIADNDARMRQVIREFVADLASELLEAADGAEAMALYDLHHPDWLLMDWRMTPLDGIRATALIKARFPDARIVIVSQYGGPAMHRLALEAGAWACLLKEDLDDLPAILTGPPGAAPDGGVRSAESPRSPGIAALCKPNR